MSFSQRRQKSFLMSPCLELMSLENSEPICTQLRSLLLGGKQRHQIIGRTVMGHISASEEIMTQNFGLKFD